MHCRNNKFNNSIKKDNFNIKVMEKINVFIVALPTFDSIIEKVMDAIDEKSEKTKCRKPFFCNDDFEDDDEDEMIERAEDLTPPRFKNHSFMPQAPIPQWGIGGKPADENLRFGYQGPCIDEPRRSDYDDREDFEYDHQLFDEYVSAAEDCIARGLEKKSDTPIHRCNAVRKKLNEAPPMNLPLIGETDWWAEEDIDWDF